MDKQSLILLKKLYVNAKVNNNLYWSTKVDDYETNKLDYQVLEAKGYIHLFSVNKAARLTIKGFELVEESFNKSILSREINEAISLKNDELIKKTNVQCIEFAEQHRDHHYMLKAISETLEECQK
ncbi:hypothetical protein ACQCT3_18060 [Sutcliffiella horikoshii]|uniref:hypothetical protein n=1 Tax=Sutcliffiella horikoshii TaxID=79883 RepID=UPI003CEF262C